MSRFLLRLFNGIIKSNIISPLGNISVENNKAERNSDSYVLLISLKYVPS